MTPEVCRRAFWQGSQSTELSIVVGQYGQAKAGGTLDPLCRWLDLPRIVVLDVSRLGSCQIPRLPAEVAGLLLDRVESPQQVAYWQTLLEPLTGAPVLGHFGRLEELRGQLAAGRGDRAAARAVARRRRDEPAGAVRVTQLLRIARQRRFHLPESGRGDEAPPIPLSVAIAYDDAFNCYFPDTLDALEAQGAYLQDFSPLRDESLPPDTDLVLFGCGHPERHAARLAGNCCMKSSLERHVRAGGRVYAEGGGLAYVCQSMNYDGGSYPMAGLLPATAHHEPASWQAAEFRLGVDSWLGRAATMVRGYVSSPWRLAPAGALIDLAAEACDRLTLVGFGPTIGSRLHLHFAAQPALFQNLLRPEPVR
jgi:cobyrinic acid a,c-diamide synthase